MQSLLRRGTSFLSSVTSFKEQARQHEVEAAREEGVEAEEAPQCPPTTVRKASGEDILFTKVDPAIDGEDCDHDCASCTIRFPARFNIDTESKLYGNVEQWATHLLVATGKTDWVRDVADEEGSVMQAIERGGLKPSNGRLMLSASNIPVPDDYHLHEPGSQPTTVLLLPSFTIIDNVTPSLAPDLVNYFINPSPTTTTLLDRPSQSISDAASPVPSIYSEPENDNQILTTPTTPISSTSPCPSLLAPSYPQQQPQQRPQSPIPSSTLSSLTPLTSRPCPHSAVILLCSQRTRDVRCGQSAPLLKREFERHLRAYGLYRDMDDERPGGVGIYFISHVGGHKYSANVMVYRRRDFDWFRRDEESGGAEEADGREKEEGAAQGIWLARVKPVDCEGIVKFTVFQGKVVKPETQLRGGFDREKGLVSW